ncbi:Bol1 protein [Pichia kluyveri]|uniref:Bol1 protein n=1 Tax=Pichia kluyveri TaxID=36015 RepID=A0AAV5QY15_PICKL|nr:Bol1 protein [Pichia kluyveri]
MRISLRAMQSCGLKTPPPYNCGPIESKIRERLNSKLNPNKLEIRNDSWKHAHHSGMKGASNTVESHFHVTIISKEFENMKSLARHRLVFGILKEEIPDIHGFQIVCKTPEEESK